jgi:calcineurin-like phosphoesterase family protein
MFFFTADTHLGHDNIIRYCNRPFASVDEMDETIIKNWNSVVSKTDTVYHLGDFSFKNPLIYLRRLNGNIILIEGNHDKGDLTGFSSVHKMKTIVIEKTTIVLCHFAMRVWEKSHFNSWHCYGHSHGELASLGKSYDVGVDNNSFMPISFDELYTIMQKLPDNENWLEKLKGYNPQEFLAAKKLVEQGIDVD